MNVTETAAQAWTRIMGTPYNRDRLECRFFTTGFHAGRGRA